MMKVGTPALQKTRVSNLSLISLYYSCKLNIYSLIILGEYELLHLEFEQLNHFITVLQVKRSPADSLFDKLVLLC
jgi:hypothetical protein